jgi:hypothetical protein
MKKIVFLFLMLVMGPLMLRAQNIEITPFGGYVFPARWNASNGSLYLDGNAQYGGMISIGMSRVVDVEFMYNRIDTKATPEVIGYNIDNIPLSQNYYMIGINKNFRVNEIVAPYAGMSLGGVYFAPKESGYYNYWFFAMGLDAGVKVYFSKVVGLRLQAQLLMPIQGGGFSFYYGSGGGGSNVYVTSTLFDFGFTGGLIFRLGKGY